MRNRRREWGSGYPRRSEFSRVTGAIALLAALGLIYWQARKPSTWQWLANDFPAAESSQQPPPAVAADSQETLVPAPTDADPAEAEDARGQFEAVRDSVPLGATEMSAYWRCMKWARAQTFADLANRADSNLHFGQLLEHPADYRGKPIRLRLHIRRILDYDAPANSAGVKRVYEFWGWTDESKSHPYVVVSSELPPGMTTGAEIHAEGDFVGYFLKLMAYTAFDTGRKAPLLVGRLRTVAESAPPAASSPQSQWLWPLAVLGAIASLGVVAYIRLRRWWTAKPVDVPNRDESQLIDWLEGGASVPSASSENDA